MTARSDVDLTTLANVIRNEGAANGNSAVRVGDILRDLIDSKVNNSKIPLHKAGGIIMSLNGTTYVCGGPPSRVVTENSDQSLITATHLRFIVPWMDTLSADRVDTLSIPSDPTKPWVANIIFHPSANGGFHRSIVNGGPAGGTLYVAPNTGGFALDIPWNGTDWVFGPGVGGGIQPWGTS